MADRQYVYKITEVVKVVDGDSFWVRCDVGFRQNILINVRLHGYDCPEAHKGSEFERSEAGRARTFAAGFLSVALGGESWIHTEKDPDNFGRWLGDIWNKDGIQLGEYLHSYELATVWPTRWRDVYDVPQI